MRDKLRSLAERKPVKIGLSDFALKIVDGEIRAYWGDPRNGPVQVGAKRDLAKPPCWPLVVALADWDAVAAFAARYPTSKVFLFFDPSLAPCKPYLFEKTENADASH